MHPSPHPGNEPLAHRRAVAAAIAQLVSPFLFIGVLFLGLHFDIPSGGDPHGYAQIFGFFASFVLLVPGLLLPGIGLPLLRRSRRSGAVLLIVAATMWALLFAFLVSGYPGGITEMDWVRIVTMVVSTIWAAVCVWSIWSGAAAYSRFPQR
jgi:hypothetical protein